nr:hypothetical protein CE91St29_17770 [Corynebacterium striatum]
MFIGFTHDLNAPTLALMNFDTAGLPGELSQLGWAFPLYCVTPVCLLVGVAAYCHRHAKRTAQGYPLRSVAWRGLMFGMILGAFFALPLPFDVTIIIASGALGVGVGWLTWYSRESVAGVFMTTASTIAGISTMVALMYVVEAFTQFDAFASSPSSMCPLLWAIFGLPAFVSAAIAAAAKTTTPADGQAVYDRPSGHQQGPLATSLAEPR